MKRFHLEELEKSYRENNLKFLNFLEKNYDVKSFRQVNYKGKERISRFILPEYLYYVKKGVLISSYYDYQGNRRSVNITSEGEILGITAFFYNTPQNWEIQVLEDAEITILPKRELDKNEAEVYNIFGSSLSYYLLMLSMGWQVMSSNGSERINYALILLTHKLGVKCDERYYLPVYVNHELIASFAAVSRSYATRCLQKLAMDGVVSLAYKMLYIQDKEKLFSVTPNYFFEDC
ncbi:hypothetical protein IGJ41_002743 [Enterococcus sp. DIV1537a]|uniref:Crp/Fnr family transcriptional regulator n=1 Tax=Enterococcus sp. DIV1537a TaxID=2774733 RepID=UPI003F203F27